MLKVKKVLHLRGYVLRVHFSDGTAREIDFKTLLEEGGFYLKPLQDIALFKQVALDDVGYSICWPNGADFSPETLHKMGKAISTRTKNVRKLPRRRSGSKKS